MSTPSKPTGYDTSKYVQAGRPDCLLTVGFDVERGRIPRFLITLHYQVASSPVEWVEIARMDHNETAPLGHDVYQEGLHVDVSRRSAATVPLTLRHEALPADRGVVIRACVGYFQREAEYFIDVYEGEIMPGGPPRWPDGGDSDSAHRFNRLRPLSEAMSQGHSSEDALSVAELTDELAEATGTPADEIAEEAAQVAIEPACDARVDDT